MDYTNQQTLLLGLQNGGTAAFEYLRADCYESVVNKCCSTSDRKEDKEDLYSDGIAALVLEINKPYFVLRGKVKTFLFEICINKYKDKLKSEKAKKNYMNEPYNESYEGNFEESIDQEVFQGIHWKSYKKLKEDCQTLLRRVFEKVPQADIAKEMGLTIGSIKNKKKNCLISLKGILDANPDYAQMKRNDEIDPD